MPVRCGAPKQQTQNARNIDVSFLENNIDNTAEKFLPPLTYGAVDRFSEKASGYLS